MVGAARSNQSMHWRVGWKLPTACAMAPPQLERMAGTAGTETGVRPAFSPATPSDLARPRDKFVMGPGGERLALVDLPAAETPRWGLRMKAQVVFAVEGGLLSQPDACARYAMSPEEFAGWKRATVQRYHRSCWSQPTGIEDQQLR